MLCALTVRTLKPGTFEEFKEAFVPTDLVQTSTGWVRFNMIRNVENPDEVISFGFFDGTVDELRRSSQEQGYADQLARIAPYVQSVGARTCRA